MSNKTDATFHGAGRGSDDEYCSTYPSEGHHYISASVDAPPIRWVDACKFCGHISSKALREQLGSDQHVIDLQEDGYTIQHPMACRPNLFDCPMNKAPLSAVVWQPGRYNCSLDAEGRFVLGAPVS